MAVAAQNTTAQFRRESLKPKAAHIWAITCPKINIFDWTFFQVLEGHGIHVTTSLELDWS